MDTQERLERELSGLQKPKVFREAFEPNSALVAAVMALTKANIPPEVQELLLYGNPDRGIAPRALQAAIVAAVRDLRGTNADN